MLEPCAARSEGWMPRIQLSRLLQRLAQGTCLRTYVIGPLENREARPWPLNAPRDHRRDLTLRPDPRMTTASKVFITAALTDPSMNCYDNVRVCLLLVLLLLARLLTASASALLRLVLCFISTTARTLLQDGLLLLESSAALYRIGLLRFGSSRLLDHPCTSSESFN